MSRFRDNRPAPKSKHTVNNQITAREFRFIDIDGTNHGVVTMTFARSRADETGLDLVQISDSNNEVIVKLMDFGKFLYEKKKQDGEAKKNQKVIQIKEVKLRPNIGDQDYKIKLKRAIEFLEDGKRVKFTLQFRGREMASMDSVGPAMFARISADLVDHDLGNLVEEKEQRGRPFWSKIVYVKGK